EIALSKADWQARGAILVRLEDVTSLYHGERNPLTPELRVSQQRLRTVGELAIGMDHDVNKVLSALALRIRILRHDPWCVVTQARNLESMDRIVSEGSALLAKLQDIGRGAPDGSALKAVDLGATIRAAVEVAQSGLRMRAVQQGVQLRIEDR